MRILLADDEPIARAMLEHWLTGWGYDVVKVTDGGAALKLLETDPGIRLALLDWIMPGLDGVEICRRLRASDKGSYTYVLLLTARDSKENIVEGLDAGADDYLVKPCNPLELRVRLRAGKRVVELQEELERARDDFRHKALHDALTGLMNRRALLDQLAREMSRKSRRDAPPLSVIMADLDHFKAVNDKHGHAAGDAVLCETARRMKAATRAYDAVGRIGGEEFCLVLPDCGAALAVGVAQRVGSIISQSPMLIPDGKLSITVSQGVASTEHLPHASGADLLRAADAALYRAKRAGRARAALATQEDLEPRGDGPDTAPAPAS